MSNIQYTSIDRVFNKLYRDLPLDNISEDDVIEWIGEALGFFGSASLSEEAIAFREVTNHQCKLPTGWKDIEQIALNTEDKIGDNNFCPKSVAEELTIEPLGPALPVILDCKGQPTQDMEVAYYRPFFDYKYDYFDFFSSYHYRKYIPINKSSGNGLHRLNFNCEEGNQRGKYGDPEYTIIHGEYARFSFREGIVAIAHTVAMTDPETGYPMVPDDISSLTAITKYITMMIMQKEFYAGREGSVGRLDVATKDWQWYCKQASNAHFMPKGIDEYQNLMNQRSYLLPDTNKYNNFFGNLGKAEDRRYNNPDRRGSYYNVSW